MAGETLKLSYNLDKCSCDLCDGIVEEGEGVLLRKCSHRFCWVCISITTNSADYLPVQCPAEISGEGQCSKFILDTELEVILSDKKYKELKIKAKMIDLFGPKQDVKETVKTHRITLTSITDGGYDSDFNLVSDRGEVEQPKNIEYGKNDYESDDGFFRSYSSNSTMNVDDINSGLRQLLEKDCSDEILDNLIDKETGLLCNTEPFDCPYCFTSVNATDGIILMDCFHLICRDCFKNLVNSTQDITVRCPYESQNGNKCKMQISAKELKQVLSRAEFIELERKTLAVAESHISESFHCRTPDCPGWCELMPGYSIKYFFCFVCKKHTCLLCKIVHDPDPDSCSHEIVEKNRKLEKLSENIIQREIHDGLTKRCPNCRYLISKNLGCDHMHCTRCDQHFSWSMPNCATIPGPSVLRTGRHRIG